MAAVLLLVVMVVVVARRRRHRARRGRRREGAGAVAVRERVVGRPADVVLAEARLPGTLGNRHRTAKRLKGCLLNEALSGRYFPLQLQEQMYYTSPLWKNFESLFIRIVL